MNKKNEVPTALLQDLFEKCAFGRGGTPRLRFRANHIPEIQAIESCERKGLIRQDADLYFITLLGVAELNTQEAQAFFSRAEHLYSSLVRRYLNEPGAPVQILDLASEFELDFSEAFSCISMMAECHLCNGGFSGANAIDNPQQAQITPAESILSYETFKSCVAYLQKMRSQYPVEDVLLSLSLPFQTLTPVNTPAPRPDSRLKASLPENQAGLLDEVYIAIDHELLTLASMGLRAVIDMVCVDQVGDKGSFKDKLSALCTADVTTKKQMEILLKVVDSGNASAHRGFKPDAEDIDTALGIVEHLLSSVYLHPQSAAELAKKTPARPSKLP
jgi:hypothetical protein